MAQVFRDRDRKPWQGALDDEKQTNRLAFHTDPVLLPKIQVDRGAIKFVLSGANIMCPGLTSKGARMETDLPNESVVAIMAEGKEHALAIGLLKMSTEEIRKINKGIGCDNIHHLNDSLWKELS
ncbi:unnamed protein product [Umbelopsis vinacea]